MGLAQKDKKHFLRIIASLLALCNTLKLWYTIYLFVFILIRISCYKKNFKKLTEPRFIS